MLNSGRRIEIAIFTLQTAASIGDTTIEPGLQQVFRKEEHYQFKKVGEDKFYAQVPISENVEVLKILFSKAMFTGGF